MRDSRPSSGIVRKLYYSFPVMFLIFQFDYLVGKAPKPGHRTNGLWCVNNLPRVVT